jgi:hypothetical protein
VPLKCFGRPCQPARVRQGDAGRVVSVAGCVRLRKGGMSKSSSFSAFEPQCRVSAASGGAGVAGAVSDGRAASPTAAAWVGAHLCPCESVGDGFSLGVGDLTSFLSGFEGASVGGAPATTPPAFPPIPPLCCGGGRKASPRIPRIIPYRRCG